MAKKERGTWGGKRKGAGKPRSNKLRCRCGVMTAERAASHYHKCPQVISNAVFSQEKKKDKRS